MTVDDVSARRCRQRDRSPLSPRPSDVLVAHYFAAVVFLIAAAVVAAVDWIDPFIHGRWLAVHLALVGGVSQLVVASSQFFAGAFLSTDMPPRRLIRTQLVLWNVGSIVLLGGMVAELRPAIDLGATMLLAAIVVAIGGLVTMQRKSLQQRRRMIRWYYTCAGFFIAGLVVGVMMGVGATWTHGRLLSAHLTLMLAGWLGTAIFGTLHTFYPSLTQTVLRFPRLEPVTYWCWVTGVVLLAVGYGATQSILVISGWAVMLIAACLLSANLIGSLSGLRNAETPALLVTVAQLALVAGMLSALIAAVAHDGVSPVGATRAGIATLFLFGWIGLTVLGSMLRLLSVVARARNMSIPPPKLYLPRALAGVAALGVCFAAVGQFSSDNGLWRAGAALLIVTYVACGLQIIAFAVRALQASRLQL